MRVEPYPRGRCHSANYWELTQILLSNVDAANAVSMERPSTLRTPKHTPFNLAAHMPTARACPAGVVLILQGYSHPQLLSFIGELEADRAC
jgi:hypothetical protein